MQVHRANQNTPPAVAPELVPGVARIVMTSPSGWGLGKSARWRGSRVGCQHAHARAGIPDFDPTASKPRA